MEKKTQMKLFVPGCMYNNKQMELYPSVRMENNKQMKLYYLGV